MSEFDIKIKRVRSIINAEDSLEDRIRNVQSDVEHVSSNLGFRIAYSNNIRGRLRRIANEVQEESRNMKELRRVLNNTANLYETAEKRIYEAVKDGKISIGEKIDGVLYNYNRTENPYFNGFFPVVGPAAGLVDLLMTGDYETKIKSSMSFEDLEDKITDKYFKDKVHEAKKKGYYKDGEWHEVDTNDEKAEKEFDSQQLNKAAQIIGVNASVEKSVFSGEGKLEGEYGKLEGSYDVFKGEAHADAYAGLYSIGPDGKKRFTPGVGGEIGVSVTALTASGTAMLGDEMLGVYAKGEVTVGKAGAALGADVGFIDGEGKFNPQANIHGELEAIAAEATAAVGVKMLGTDVSGNVGVNVGVGVHADVGLHDGVLSLDLGAAVGVGVSVNLEIDFSGTVEMAAGVISDVTSNACEFIGSLFPW